MVICATGCDTCVSDCGCSSAPDPEAVVSAARLEITESRMCGSVLFSLSGMAEGLVLAPFFVFRRFFKERLEGRVKIPMFL